MNATSATTATNRRRHDFWSRLQREFDDWIGYQVEYVKP
jgi:hypothetical protein